MNITKKFASLAVGTAIAGGLAIASASPAHAATSVWDSVAACESSGNWSINTGNGYYGGLQFSESTWLAYGGGNYAQYANQATKAEQIAVAQKVLASQGPEAWPVCSVSAGLTTANGGASSTSTTTTSNSSTSTSSSSSSTSANSTSASSTGSKGIVTKTLPKPTKGTHGQPPKGAHGQPPKGTHGQPPKGGKPPVPPKDGKHLPPHGHGHAPQPR